MWFLSLTSVKVRPVFVCCLVLSCLMSCEVCCVRCVVGCVGGVRPRFGRTPPQPDPLSPQPDTSSPGPPKISLFFSLSRHIFLSFFLSWGLWCYVVVTRGLPRQPENSKRAHFRVRAPALQTPPKFHGRTPRERRKNENCGGRVKKREFLGLPLFGAFFYDGKLKRNLLKESNTHK